MSGPGGTKTVRCSAAFTIGLLLAGGLAACASEDVGKPQPTAAGQSHRPAQTIPAKAPDVLAVETTNYAELDQRLAGAPGTVLLADSGPADGTSVGFRKTGTVKAAGPYTVTAACVGIPHAQISVSQNITDGTQHLVLEVDCSGVQTQVVELQAGYVSAQVTHRDPTGPWTGAVAGIRITEGTNVAAQ